MNVVAFLGIIAVVGLIAFGSISEARVLCTVDGVDLGRPARYGWSGCLVEWEAGKWIRPDQARRLTGVRLRRA